MLCVDHTIGTVKNIRRGRFCSQVAHKSQVVLLKKMLIGSSRYRTGDKTEGSLICKQNKKKHADLFLVRKTLMQPNRPHTIKIQSFPFIVSQCLNYSKNTYLLSSQYLVKILGKGIIFTHCHYPTWKTLAEFFSSARNHVEQLEI